MIPVLHYHKTSGYKYRVAESVRVAVPELAGEEIEAGWFMLREGVLTIFAGYAWDGASGPTLDTPATMLAGLVHDALYQAIRAGLLDPDHRATADMILYRLMRSAPGLNVWREIRAAYYFIAVRAFGRRSTRPRKTEPQDRVYLA